MVANVIFSDISSKFDQRERERIVIFFNHFIVIFFIISLYVTSSLIDCIPSLLLLIAEINHEGFEE